MNRQIPIICISRKTVSYAVASDTGFCTEKEEVSPCSFTPAFVRNSEQRLMEISGISDDSCFESGKSNLSLLLLFANDIDATQADGIAKQFSKKGFSSLRMSRMDSLVSEYFQRDYSPEAVVTLNSDGLDFFVSLSLRAQPQRMARRIFKGAGADPRVTAIVEEIWRQVIGSGIEADRKANDTILKKAAVEFLKSGVSEVEKGIRLSEGYESYYCLNRRLINSIECPETVKLQNGFSEMLMEYGVTDRSRSAIVLQGDALNDDYFTERLVHGFGTKTHISGSILDAVGRLIVESCLDGKLPDFPDGELEKHPAGKKTRTPGAQTSSQSENPFVGAPIDLTRHREGAEIEKTVHEEVTCESQADSDSTHTESSGLVPVNVEITAVTEKVKIGLLKKKTVLKIRVDIPELRHLKWHSVLCVQDKPMNKVELQNIVGDFSRNSTPPFNLSVDLPIKQCPDAKKLRIYFKPHPEEQVGINQAYAAAPLSINV